MTNFKNFDWEAIKSFCNKVADADYEKRAEAFGLRFIFSLELGIFECRVYFCLYKRTNGRDVDILRVSENNYFATKDKVDAYFEELERLLNGGYNEDVAYEAELKALNEKYGR